MAPPAAVVEEAASRLPLSGLAAGQGDVAQVQDGKWVSLRVENPALERQQVVAGEQQVQIPGGDGGVGGDKAEEKQHR